MGARSHRLMWRDDYNCEQADRQLAAYRGRKKNSGELAPLTPDEIDFEMGAYPRSKHVIDLNCITQEGLEHFVQKYGSTYRGIHLSWASRVKDLSPLSDLPALEFLAIADGRCDRLWDMSRNKQLRFLIIDSCKKLTETPILLDTAPSLETVWYLGGAESCHPMASLQGFSHLPAIKEIRLQDIRLRDRCLDFLDTIPTLETFDFEANMFTTNEIAWMRAKYPQLGGEFLRAYGPAYPGSNSWVRVSGSRKPELQLPEEQERLDKYVRAFDEMVKQYRQEIAQPCEDYL